MDMIFTDDCIMKGTESYFPSDHPVLERTDLSADPEYEHIEPTFDAAVPKLGLSERLRPGRLFHRLAAAATNLLDAEPHHHHHHEHEEGHHHGHEKEDGRLVSKLGHRAIIATQFLATAVETAATATAFVAGGVAATFGAAWANIGHGVADVGAHMGHDRLDEGTLSAKRQRQTRRLTFAAVRVSGLLAVTEGASTLAPCAASLASRTGQYTGSKMLERAGETTKQKLAELSEYSFLPFHGLQEKTASTFQMAGSAGQIAAAGLTWGILAAAIRKKHGGVEAMYAKDEAEAGHDQDRYKHSISDVKISAVGGATIGVPGLLPEALATLQSPLQILGATALLWVGGRVVRDFKHHVREHEKEIPVPMPEDGMEEAAAMPEKRYRFRKTVLALGAGAAAACTVLTGSLNGAETPVIATAPPPTVEIVTDDPGHEQNAPGCIVVEAGDSQWDISKRHATTLLGSEPSEELTRQIATMTANLNAATHPNPHVIYPGDCISVPTGPAMRAFQTAAGS